MNGPPPLDALVIGASGQDGRFLLDACDAAGLKAAGTSRRGGALLRVDPGDAAALHALLDETRPRRIFLLAGQSSVGASFQAPFDTVRSHVEPLLAALEWLRLRAAPCRLVYAASAECFGPRTADDPAREGDAFRPVNPYGAAKAMAASLLRGYRAAYGLHASNAFLFNHESHLRPERFVFGKLLAGIDRLRSGQDRAPVVLGDLSVVRDWGWAPDYCAAMLAMSDRPVPEDLILATGHSVSLREAVAALLAEAGLDADAVASDPAAHGHALGDAQHADPARARAAIGWTGSTPFPELAALLLKRAA